MQLEYRICSVMEEIRVKRNIKDTVFTDFFGDVNNVLKMYQVLHPEDTEARAEDIDIVTLGNVLVDGIYNDLGFKVGNRLMVLVEAQSTWSENIIVRALMYLVQTYQDYINENRLDVYSSARIELPEPELYVIYTGNKKDRPDVLKFSDKFFGGKKTAVDVSVKVLCGESRENVVGQYIAFCRIYDEVRREYGGGREAIEKVIEICRNENVLKEYLEKREKEVINIMLTLFDEETIMANHDADVLRRGRNEGMQQGMQKGIEKGKAEGRADGILSTLWNLLNGGAISLSVAAKQAGMSEEAFLKTKPV